MDKRELVLQTFNNERPERTPVGFWFHFIEDPEADGFKNPALFQQNIAGHKKFFEEFEPDFVKIMTDGFFIYPNERFIKARNAAEFGAIESIGANNEWIEKQVEFAKTIRAMLDGKVLSFYNVFSPATLFRFCRKLPDGKRLADFIIEDREAAARALNTVARDLAVLVERILGEAEIDGIYYSVQDINDERIDDWLRQNILDPVNCAVLDAANKKSRYNILHICGYEGFHNKLSHFIDYPAQIINWAAVVENETLGKGKKLFNGKPVIGGFGSTTRDVLYRGGRPEIEAKTAAILQEAGTKGIALGADCTLPPDINLDHLRRVRDKAAAISK
ncbi:MAG: uroporphyrinogen decarboxylase [Spirochaetaceae bacterium]|jgi:uroporphyrinogen decarboxylase|nr:uroporphyrinogen decarboxylase [Spirochaetaceae bacterium]